MVRLLFSVAFPANKSHSRLSFITSALISEYRNEVLDYRSICKVLVVNRNECVQMKVLDGDWQFSSTTPKER